MADTPLDSLQEVDLTGTRDATSAPARPDVPPSSNMAPPANPYLEFVQPTETTPAETTPRQDSTDGNPYLDLLDEEERVKIDALRGSMYLGVQKNPDSVADIVRIAKETGMPIDVVERNKDRIEADRKLMSVNLRDMVKYSPEVARFLSRPENAALAHDDIATLMRSESAFSDLNKGEFGSAMNSLARAGGQMAGDIVKYPAIVRANDAAWTLSLLDALDQGAQYVNNNPATPVAIYRNNPTAKAYLKGSPEDKAAIRKQLQREMDPRTHAWYAAGQAIDDWVKAQFKTNPLYEEGFLTGKVPQGFGSMLSFLALSALTRNPAAVGTLASMQVGSGALEEALQSGASIEEALKASNLNFMTGYTEVIPIARILDRADKFAKGGIRKALLDLIKGGAEESLQEVFQQIWQNFVAAGLVKYDPERNLFTGAGEAAGVAFTVGGLTQLLVGLLLGRRAKMSDVGVPDTLEQNKIDELNDIGRQAKLVKRAPETAREFLAQVQETYGAEEPVYVPAAHLQELVDQGVIKEGENATIDHMIAQMKEALPVGGDVIVPVSDYIVDVASKPEVAQAMREMVRLSPDTLSIREAQEVNPENAARIMRMIEDAGRAADIRVEADQVVNQIVDHLVSTGVVMPEVARVNAKIFSAYVTRYAERTGKTPLEVFQDMGLQIQGPKAPTLASEPIYQPGQDFGDLQIEETTQIAETGETVTIKQRAQDLWDSLQEKRTKLSDLVNCLYG